MQLETSTKRAQKRNKKHKQMACDHTNANRKIVHAAKQSDEKMKNIAYKIEDINAIVDYTHIVALSQGKTIDNIMYQMNEDLATHKKMVHNLRVGLKRAKSKRYYKVILVLIAAFVCFIITKFVYNIVF